MAGYDQWENEVPRDGVYEQASSTRGQFLFNTYVHLFAAILAFVGIEIYLFQSGLAEKIAAPMMQAWWAVLGAFMVVGWLATRYAHTSTSKATQYLALGAYVVADALIFCPLLLVANSFAPGAIESAAQITILGFSLLTAIVFVTGKDFSFLRSFVMWGGIAAILAIVGGMWFGFHLGTWFSVAMIFLAGAAILYDTSAIMRDYPEDRYVGAALQLFASVALMFWYVLQLVMSMQSDD